MKFHAKVMVFFIKTEWAPEQLQKFVIPLSRDYNVTFDQALVRD